MRRALCLLAAAAAVATGCGDDGVDVRYLNHPGVIRQADVERVPAGTPERTVMEWARAAVFSDAAAAVRLYDPALRAKPKALARRAEELQWLITTFRGVRFVTTERQAPGRVRVVARVLFRTKDGKAGRLPLAFPVRRVDGEWKIAKLLPALVDLDDPVLDRG
ncbi:MAG: hypothetical protein JW895_06060 [Thermoleophilaceae bacterium]|nr:hypothetical protein [Thermoleophilaceae bacterium]